MSSSWSGIQVILDTDNSLLWESLMYLLRAAHLCASTNEKIWAHRHMWYKFAGNYYTDIVFVPVLYPAVSFAAIESRVLMVIMLLRIVQVAGSNLVQSNHYFYSDISTFPNSLHTRAYIPLPCISFTIHNRPNFLRHITRSFEEAFVKLRNEGTTQEINVSVQVDSCR